MPVSGDQIHDTIASLIYGKLFERFPSLRLATVELGCAWLPTLFRNFELAGRGDLDEDPIDIFRRHFWVTPFEHENVAGLADAIGVERVLFGSDYPHTDGLAEPASIIDSLKEFDRASLQRILHDNGRELVGRRRPG